ncbi:uncharacterized protein TNCV_3371071 [Trichonephila clavipes]|nr:uncharacterized protein TNCV_3371071 [Trichonephila clavipes]
MTCRKGIIPDEIANLLRELSENESDGGWLALIEDIIRLSESDCKGSEESAEIINNILVNPDIYVAGNNTEWIPHNSNVPGRFETRNVLRQSSYPISLSKHNINVRFL